MMTPMKAIRAKCLDCCCGSPSEVRLCPSEKCPLYPYRSGHRPAPPVFGQAEQEAEKTGGLCGSFSAQNEKEEEGVS